MIHFLRVLCRYNFGEFEEEEFKKFLRLGLIFSLIIAVHWTLHPLKDSIFIQLVDKMYLPYAKLVTLIGLLPLVGLYTKLFADTSKEKMLTLLPTFYGFAILIFSILIYTTHESAKEIEYCSIILYISVKALGYIWYLFAESFGLLTIALFWTFTADITNAISAKKGFPLIVALGQIGGVICPYCIAGLSHHLGFVTDTLAIVILSILTFTIIPCVRYFLKVTPAHLLSSFQTTNQEKLIKKKGSSFGEGLKIILSHKYLTGIFMVNFVYEFIMTIFDFNFKLAAATHYSGVALSHYLSVFASSVNLVSLLCLLLGISNIARFLGIRLSIIIMPSIMGLALLIFLFTDSLFSLFFIMVGSKAVNYSLNSPSLKQLYIPLTTDARFKAEAWIDAFGHPFSKEVGSVFNMLLKPFQIIFSVTSARFYYLGLSGLIGFPLLIAWFITALYLGKVYHDASKENKTIC